MNSLWVLGVEPIRLVTGESPVSSGAGWWGGWALPAIGVILVVGLLVLAGVYVLPRLSLDRDPGERAFKALARKLHLTRGHRATLRALAGMVEAPPVALLLCRSAFVRAIGQREEAGHTDPAERSRILELEHKVFG